jgi:hypothetical protein
MLATFEWPESRFLSDLPHQKLRARRKPPTCRSADALGHVLTAAHTISPRRRLDPCVRCWSWPSHRREHRGQCAFRGASTARLKRRARNHSPDLLPMELTPG